jgi:hypothetical protein
MTSIDIEGDDKAEWSNKTEGVFIRVLHEHVKKGDMQTSTFKKKVWSDMSDVVC